MASKHLRMYKLVTRLDFYGLQHAAYEWAGVLAGDSRAESTPGTRVPIVGLSASFELNVRERCLLVGVALPKIEVVAEHKFDLISTMCPM